MSNGSNDPPECFKVQEVEMSSAPNGWLLDILLRITEPKEISSNEFDAAWSFGDPLPETIRVTPIVQSQPSQLYLDVDHSFMTVTDNAQRITEGEFWNRKLYSGILALLTSTSSSSQSTTGNEVYCNCNCGDTASSCEPLPRDSRANNIQAALECVGNDVSAGSDVGEACDTTLPASSTLVVIRGRPRDLQLFNTEMSDSDIGIIAADIVNRYSPSAVPEESKIVVLVLGRGHVLSTKDLDEQSTNLYDKVQELAGNGRIHTYLVPMKDNAVDRMADLAKHEIEKPSQLRVTLLLPKLLTRSQAKDAGLRIINKESSCKSVPISLPEQLPGAATSDQVRILFVLRYFPQALLYVLIPLVVLGVSLFTYRYDLFGARTRLNQELDFPWLPKE